MSKVGEIEDAIRRLSPRELAAFRKWFAEFDAAAWDRQIEEDVAAGNWRWAMDRGKLRGLRLRRPLAVLDLETTGLSKDLSRIVAIAVLKVLIDGTTRKFHSLVNPEMHIPMEASAIHGITDGDVRRKPTFPQIAPRLARFLKGCNVAGFNIRRFDLPILVREFQRADTRFHVPELAGH